MIPQTEARKKKNSSKVNLAISFTVHAVLVAVLIYFAAREGFLGKKLQKISVTMVHEKPPEKPKEPEKKVEPPKVEPPKVQEQKVVEPPKAAEPPPVAAPPVVAPTSTEVPAFEFSGGATVLSESDPVQLYKSYMEYNLREKWNKPENVPDDNYIAEVQVDVDRHGNISHPVWQKGSGDPIWDASVREVFNVVKNIDRSPPTNFPPQVTIRFDVQELTEPVSP
jgi:outer membrane biosynthesis protein TonB